LIRLSCEHGFVSAARTFHECLLDLLPIYSEAGRALAAIEVPDGLSAATFADTACRRRFRRAKAPPNDAFNSIAGALADTASPTALIEVAYDACMPVEPGGNDDVATTARHAEARARAAANGDDAAADHARLQPTVIADFWRRSAALRFRAARRFRAS
jgi:hypothetical protein